MQRPQIHGKCESYMRTPMEIKGSAKLSEISLKIGEIKSPRGNLQLGIFAIRKYIILGRKTPFCVELSYIE